MEEAERIGDLLYPLIYQGHSVYHACLVLKDQLMLSEKTIYSYIEGGVLNIKNIDLPRKVRYRQRKKPREFKVDKGCRIGRSYENYLSFMEENENPAVVQMDSVKGDMSGKVLLTIHFVETGFMLAFIREQNTAKSVTDIFNKLYEELGRELFMKLFPVILTDNGSEFSDPMKIEFDENGERRTYIFYCDQNRSDQKGSIEVNHEFIRRISPKGKSFNERSQEDIDLMMSHINSYKRKRLNNQSPYTAFSLFYGSEIPQKLGIEEIPADEVRISPELLKK
jgi:IS30 family transposase